MPLHSDNKLRWLRALQCFDNAIFRANSGNYELLSRAIDRLMMARIDKKPRRFLTDPNDQSRET